MQIHVIKLLSDVPMQALVEFQSPYGIGRALWADGIPQLLKNYDVEYEIPETLVWNQTIVHHDEEITAVTYQENALHLYGQLESLEGDGIGCIRLGTSILLVEIEVSEGYQPVLGFVRLISKHARLYNTHT
jgi:hypothetical protein